MNGSNGQPSHQGPRDDAAPARSGRKFPNPEHHTELMDLARAAVDATRQGRDDLRVAVFVSRKVDGCVVGGSAVGGYVDEEAAIKDVVNHLTVLVGGEPHG